MSKLLIASTNQGKVREIESLLASLEIELVTPDQLGLNLDLDEVGETYAENAQLKGIAFARASGLLTLADDSGLEVEALNGKPGVRSARFSPKPGATDADRRVYLLEQLQGHPQPWLARFRCVVVLVTASGEMHFSEGLCAGQIISTERGDNGFGYDPIFLLTELGRTMAELTTEDKNQLSHRARAIQAARPKLIGLLNLTQNS